MSGPEHGTTALLGAGASMDAGIPGAIGLTATIGEHLATQDGDSSVQLPVGGLSRVLEDTYRRLVAHQLAGGTLTPAVDVEQLFSAVQLLSQGDGSAVAPFVGEWEVYEPAGGPLRAPQLYAALGEAMLDALRQVLVPQKTPNYLRPLLAANPCRIATLNYDRCVELAAESSGVGLTDGVENWTGGFRWDWGRDEAVRLLKLHGSIDWTPIVTTLGGTAPAGEQVFTHGPPARGSGSAELEVPGLVFGAQGKLRADGPFLAMLMEFSRWMETTDRLVVVGYSCRDRHINRVIVDRLEQPHPLRVDIIDPAVPADHRDVSGQPGGPPGRPPELRHRAERRLPRPLRLVGA